MAMGGREDGLESTIGFQELGAEGVDFPVAGRDEALLVPLAGEDFVELGLGGWVGVRVCGCAGG